MRKEQSPSSGTYSTWLDKPVLLHIATGTFLTVLNCMIVSESDGGLRIRVGNVWDLDIYKEMVLAVEPALCVDEPLLKTSRVQEMN
jgi:hypothetical protein